MVIHKFYDKQDVEKFLDKYDFIYRIPNLKDGFHYEVAIHNEIVEFAKVKHATNIPVHLAGRYFYDRKEMTYMQFGVKKEKFIIDLRKKKLIEERNAKIKSQNKPKTVKWKGEDFRLFLKKTEGNIFKNIPIGKDNIKISIQGGKYFESCPKEFVDVFNYEAFEIAFFKKTEMIFKSTEIKSIFEHFERKDELFNYTDDGIVFKKVPIDLIQDSMMHIRYKKKRTLEKNKKNIG